jgi:two-component system, OmpR family, KDP operon response regulator KdpE
MSAPPLRVLVIDDEPPIRKLLRVGLSAHGYQITEASSGKMALELLGEQRPHLIVLDLGLPDMQGHELLRMIRARNDSVPIVVLSSRDDEAGKVQALDSGASRSAWMSFWPECARRFATSCRLMASGRSSASATFRSIWCGV